VWFAFIQCAFRNNTQAHNQKILTVIRDYPEIEDMISPVDETPLELPVHDHFTHLVADTVLAVNDEHYSVIYLGTGILNHGGGGCTDIVTSADT